MLKNLFDLPKVVIPYILHPLSAAEVFLPHAPPVAWFTGSNLFNPGRDIPHLDGKVFLVTGGNAGLGAETVYQLARHDPAQIYLAARTSDKAQQAISDIEKRLLKEGKQTKVKIQHLPLDLSDFDSVAKAAQTVLAGTKRLDVLILNAGIMAVPPSRAKSGHDLQLCTNHIGHFLLVNLLLPLLEQTASHHRNSDVRVISVSSEAYNIAPSNVSELVEDHDRLCSCSNYTRYGVSKAANILFASELARRYSEKNIISVSLHPGIVLTQLYNPTTDSNLMMRYGLPLFARIIFDDVPHGALGQLFLAVGASKEAIVNGSYYTPVGRRQSIALTDDKEQARRLWRWTEEQLKNYLS